MRVLNEIYNYFKALTFIAAIATSHHIMAMQPQKENRAPKQLTCAKEYFSKDDLQKFLETKPTEFELHQKLLDVMIERFAQYEIKMVATLLRHGAPVDLIDPDYGTPLLIAVTKQDIDAVKLILSYHPNVNLGLFHEGGRGVPPLTMIIRLGATDIAKLILAEENTVVDEIVGGYTAFLRAVEKGLNDLVPLMIKKQANLVHSKDHLTLSTPLHWAVRNKNYELIVMLLNHGIELDSKDGFGNTALHYASGSGLTQIAKLLLDKGADVNAAGSQLLTYYFQYGIRFGELAQEGLTALDIALRRGLHETARLLCKYGALVTNFSKNLLLHDESLSRLVHLNNQETVKLDNLGDISFSTNISAKTLNTDSSASKIIFTEVVFKAIDAEPKLYELTFSSNQEAGREFSKKIIVKAIASASDARQIAAFKFMEKKQSKYVEKKSSAFEGAQTHKKTGKGKPVRNDKIVLYGNPPIFKRAQKQRGCAMQRFLVSA